VVHDNVNVTRLLSGTGELCGIEYFKLVFFKYLNVPTWSILLAWSQMLVLHMQGDFIISSLNADTQVWQKYYLPHHSEGISI